MARADDPQGQSGAVIDVEIMATVNLPNTEVVVTSTRNLRTVHPFMQGVRVARGGWLGKCVGCDHNVLIRFDDGSICRVLDVSPEVLPLPNKQEEYDETTYFPSMVCIFFPYI